MSNAKLFSTPILVLSVVIIDAYWAGGLFHLWIGRPTDSVMPWTTLQYYLKYGHIEHIQNKLIISHLGGLVPFGLIAFLILTPKKRSLHGDARFANIRDVKNVDLLKDRGLLIGKLGGKSLFSDGPFHVLLSVETRGGKGVSFVIPNLLSWPDSAIILDIKKENWNITSGFRAKYGQQCYLFDPLETEFKTHRFNPLAYIPNDKIRRIDVIQKISNYFVPDPLKGDPLWTSEARKLFEGLVLLCCDLDEFDQTFGQIFRLLHTEQKTHEYLEELIQSRRSELDPLCIMDLSAFIQTTDKTRSGIKAQLTSALNMFSNPLIDAATSGNDFDLRKLKAEKMSIYIGVSPGNLKRLSPLINLFFQLTIDLNTQVLPENDPTYKHELLLLPDEFTSIGRMDVIGDGISFIAGYGIRLAAIVQSEHQIMGTYGEHVGKNMIKNFHARVNYTPNNMEDAELISRELGFTTVTQQSQNRKSAWASKQDRSYSTSLTKRALMLPQEVKEMAMTESIIFVKGCLPIKAKRHFYYKEKVFRKRLLEPVPVKALTLGESTLIETKYVMNFDDEALPAGINDDVIPDRMIEEAADEFAMAFLNSEGEANE